MNTVYKNINMKVKLWEEKIILLPDWERRKKKIYAFFKKKKKKKNWDLSALTHYTRETTNSVLCGCDYPFYRAG